MPWTDSYLSKLETHLDMKFSAIGTSYRQSEVKMSRLKELVGSSIPAEASFVAFGSLARKEYTSGSDLDWALVIDGRADAEHRALELDLKQRIKASGEFHEPNPAGTFGALAFSHELIHCIGGNSDTNKNLTLRLLLLLESAEAENKSVRSPREQLIRGILQRYFEEEANFSKREFFPRFFLNDVIRFWRTMAVDYAAKNSERSHEKWALRNAKLRFSRKLLYIAGLLLTYEPTIFPTSDLIADVTAQFDEEQPQFSSTEHCFQATKLTPLELFARACLSPALKMNKRYIKIAFEAYDRFLKMMDSKAKREQLGRLTYAEALDKKVFQEMRELGHEFQNALEKLFLDPATKIGKLTLKYVTF